MVGEVILAVLKGTLHQCRLACARLPLEPEHAMVGGEAVALAPLKKFGGREEPVAGAGEGGLDVFLARAQLFEGERAKAVWVLFSTGPSVSLRAS